MTPGPPESPRGPLPGGLGFGDAVSLIIGIVVGATIFELPSLIFQQVASPGMALAAWGLGGVLSLIGAFCYAELATTYPRSGGDYVYLTRAYGPAVGFLFGWAHLIGILTGSIGVLAYVFARFAAPLLGLGTDARLWWLAAAAVAGLSLLNLVGVVLGKAAQNVLTLAKVLGLAGIVVAGFGWGEGLPTAAGLTIGTTDPALAMVFVLYAYGGWNDAAFVAAEVRNPRRNLPLALLTGIGAITLIYLLVNAAYLWGLGFAAARHSAVPLPTAVLERMLGPAGGKGLSVLVVISALGGLNGLILTGSRVQASLGADHRLFAPLARWNRFGSPVGSLLAQGAISVGLVVLVGTAHGHAWADRALGLIGRGPVNWPKFASGGEFATLVAATAPIFWLFFLLTGLSLFVLRWRDRHWRGRNQERPFRVPLYPLTPILFCLTCGFMLWRSLLWAGDLALLALVPLACGVPLYFVSRALGTAK